MEAVDLYGDLEDPFFFKDQSPQPSSQVDGMIDEHPPQSLGR